jgi:esterase/lipase superfamily enzyme
LEERHIRFYSKHLDREIEMLVFGNWGIPVLLFPSTLGRYYEVKDFGLIDSVAGEINSGKFKVYSIDTTDNDSWYARNLHPSQRVLKYIEYDKFLANELVPAIQSECNADRIVVAGCSLGGYHAANFAFRYPDKVECLISMSGAFDMKTFMDGYYDENFYFNNPIDYMANEQGWRFGHMKIVLGTSEWDICLNSNLQMSGVLNQRGIDHWLNIWGNEKHDWPLWNKMFPTYLSRLLG